MAAPTRRRPQSPECFVDDPIGSFQAVRSSKEEGSAMKLNQIRPVRSWWEAAVRRTSALVSAAFAPWRESVLAGPTGNALQKSCLLAVGTLVIVCVGCVSDGHQLMHRDEYHAPPAAQLAAPGPMVAGPGPGVMNYGAGGGGGGGGMGMCPPGAGGGPGTEAPRTSQIRFLGPEGMSIGWQSGQGFAANQLIAPGTYNFTQAATYRLKFAHIKGREALTIYPSLHVYPSLPGTDAYLAHNALPLRITDEDLDQIETNNFVTKVIYLPDARFQDLAIGVEELVSTRLGPGLDPVTEADRRGTIMAVLHMGNVNLEMPNQGGEALQNGVSQTGYEAPNGEENQYVEPMPVGSHLGGGYSAAPRGSGMPTALMMGGPSGPGQAPYHPIAGANAPMWGYPSTATPIGLPGPPHLPYGRPAGLKSHTVRNLTDVDLPRPVDHLLYDVRHEPGIRMPPPVKHIEYTEKHPVYSPGELSSPAWQQP